MTWTITPGKRLPKYLWLKHDKPTVTSDEIDISKYLKNTPTIPDPTKNIRI